MGYIRESCSQKCKFQVHEKMFILHYLWRLDQWFVLASQPSQKSMGIRIGSSPYKRTLKPVFHSHISPPLAKNFAAKKFICCSFAPSTKGQTEVENFKQLYYLAGEQIYSAANECKKMISLSKYFASGGEICEWKTGLTDRTKLYSRLTQSLFPTENYLRQIEEKLNALINMDLN